MEEQPLGMLVAPGLGMSRAGEQWNLRKQQKGVDLKPWPRPAPTQSRNQTCFFFKLPKKKVFLARKKVFCQVPAFCFQTWGGFSNWFLHLWAQRRLQEDQKTRR